MEAVHEMGIALTHFLVYAMTHLDDHGGGPTVQQAVIALTLKITF